LFRGEKNKAETLSAYPCERYTEYRFKLQDSITHKISRPPIKIRDKPTSKERVFLECHAPLFSVDNTLKLAMIMVVELLLVKGLFILLFS